MKIWLSTYENEGHGDCGYWIEKKDGKLKLKYEAFSGSGKGIEYDLGMFSNVSELASFLYEEAGKKIIESLLKKILF